MVTKAEQLAELRTLLGEVMRGLWHRRRPSGDLLELVHGDPPLSRRHVVVLAHIGTEGERTVGEIATELGLSLPAVSKLTRDLERHNLVYRREHIDDRRRTVVDLNALTQGAVREWLDRRSTPLEQALDALDATERESFLKGMRALAAALMEESPGGPLRSHHRTPHRRRSHRHRPL